MPSLHKCILSVFIQIHLLKFTILIFLVVLDDIWNKPDLYSFVLIIWLVSVVLNFHSNSEFEAKWPDWEAINWLILLINIPDRVLFVKFYNCQEIYIMLNVQWNYRKCMKYTKVWMIKMDVKSLCTRHGCG